MTDLTEQWKKGELDRNKIYYYETPFNTTDTASGYWLCNHLDTEKDKVTVLGEVPSYERYLSLTYAKEEDEKIIAEYEAENTKLKEELKDYEYQHKQDGICYDDIFCKLELARKENIKLKTDCRTIAQKLLKVKPELREWLEINYGEYL